MSQVENFVPFPGMHCETNATGNLLKHAGFELSEPMLFGLGEGLSYGMFNFKSMPAPFIGGRPRPNELTETLARNLDLELDFRKTSSKKRAWENVATFIDAGQPVAVRVDCYYLDYFTTKIHFGGHYVAMHGYDDDFVYVADTSQQGSVMKTDREKFAEGRLWKGSMAPNGQTWTITVPNKSMDWPAVIQAAIVNNAETYLNPPIHNLGAKGIRKTAKVLPTWVETVAPNEFYTMGMLMEHAGTGGALFRNFYRDFLTEAMEHLQHPNLEAARDEIAEAAPLWTAVANGFMAVPDNGIASLNSVVPLLHQLADLEESAMTKLSTISA